MFDSFALLISDAYQALGYPERHHLDPEDLTRAAFQALAFFGLDAAQSEYGRAASSIPFSASSREVMIGAQDVMLPSYIERRRGAQPHDQWEWIPMVRSAVLEDARSRGWAAASVFQVEEGFRVGFSYDPTGYDHRLRYYTEPTIVGTREDPLPIPQRYGFMLSHQTVVNAVPMMLVRSAHLPETQQLTTRQLEALTAVVGHAQSELARWEPLWKTEKTADRNARGRNRRPLVPRGW